jgi:hypothetical protein
MTDTPILAGHGLRLVLMAARSPTLGEVAFRNLQAAGYGRIRAMKKASEALTTLSCLAIAASRSENGFPTQAEYAAYWKQTERSAQRDWQRFREAFPSEESPERLARWLVSEYGRRLAEHDDPGFAFTLPADAAILAAAN